jgi:serine/threonine protein phosphatase PrpC
MGVLKRLFHRGADQGVEQSAARPGGTTASTEGTSAPDERTPTRLGDSPADKQLSPTISTGEPMNDESPESQSAPAMALSSPDEPTPETVGTNLPEAQVTAYASTLPPDMVNDGSADAHPPIEPPSDQVGDARPPEREASAEVPAPTEEGNVEASEEVSQPPADPESPRGAEEAAAETPAASPESPPIAPNERGIDPFSAPVAELDPTVAEATPAGPAVSDGPPDNAEVDAVPTFPAPGAKLGGRYVVVKAIDVDEAIHLLGGTVHVVDADLFAVEDTRAFERCWSCGSAGNVAGQRFCIDCGALLQNRQLVLARTAAAKGESEEFSEHGSYFHLVRPRKQFGNAGLALEVGSWSAEGPHHPNEDSYWMAVVGGCFNSKSDMFGVMVLADGMGGYAPGSGLISKMIVNSVGRSVFHLLHTESETEKEEVEIQTVIRSAVAEANSKVLKEIEVHGEMGATLVVTVVYGQSAFIANIGDSRAYYIAPSGTVNQITRDQSLIEQQVAAGLLTVDAAFTAFGNNVILHAIGEEGVEEAFDWYVQPLEPGGRLLLCTDGYWKTVRRDVWDDEMALGAPTLRTLARSMVESALAKGSDDNTTVLVVGID